MVESTETSLGQRLSPLFQGGFFRPLTRPSAAIYVDCADRLVAAADEGGQVPYDDARLLIREVLARHPDVVLDDDEGGGFRDLGQRAGQFFNQLLHVRWLEPRRVSLDQHHVLIAPPLRRVLRVLRELAEDRPAELKDFAATLKSLCRDLLTDGTLDPNQQAPEAMRQTVKDLVARAERAEDQMHAVESLIHHHEAAQRLSGSAGETLQRFLVDFHAGEHMVCYDALQAAGLLPRLNQARAVAQEALHDPFTKQRLAEGLATHLNIDASQAYLEAEQWLLRLERLLTAIPIKQRLIDGRMADFSRLSAARYRYQTELRGRRPEQVKQYLADAGRVHSGQSFADLANEPGMTILSPTVEIYFGADSLSRPRRHRAPVNLTFAPSETSLDAEAAKDEIRLRNLNLLTPQRAAKFVERHLASKGDRLSSEDLRILTEDDLLDLLAVVAFDRGPTQRGSKPVRWRIRAWRADHGTVPSQIPRDRQADRWVERFSLERLG